MNLKSKQFQSIVPGNLNSINVNDDLTFALRRYKKMQKDSKVVVELFDRKFYDKPSVHKKKKMDNAKYNQTRESQNEI